MQEITINIADGDEHPTMPYIRWDKVGGLDGPGWVVRYLEAGSEMEQGLIARDPENQEEAQIEAAELVAKVCANRARVERMGAK